MGRILVVCAHADDETLGAGGTIAKHTGQGDEIHVLYLTDPKSQVHGNGTRLFKECRRAAGILCIQETYFTGFPDQKLDTIPQGDLIREIDRIIFSIQPELVYTHTAIDVNADHRAVCFAALVSCRPWRSPVRRIRTFPIPGNDYHKKFNFNEYEDIDKTMELKMRALRAYESELECWGAGDPKRPENVWALCKQNAWCLPCEFAEVFWTIGGTR